MLVGAESRANDVMRARIVRCRQEWSTTQVRLAARSVSEGQKNGINDSHTQSLATERRLVGEQVKLLQRLDCCGRLDYMLQVACDEHGHGDC